MNSLKILDIFIGNRCNLTCFQCDTRSDIFRKGEYDTDIDNIKESISLAKKHFNVDIYSLLGGEPLMYLDTVEEILKFIRSIDPSATILIPTNGSLINKYLDRIAYITKNYKVYLNVCNHYSAFNDQTKADEVRSYTKNLAEELFLQDRNPVNFYLEVLKYNNTSPEWNAWMNYRGTDEIKEIDDQFWSERDYGVFLHDQDTFHQNHYFEGHSPKPFSEGRPDESYKNGCCSPFCSYLYDKKLYKCAALGTLKRFLEHHDADKDPDWQKYLAYKPLDLLNCTEEEVKQFSDTKFKSIEQCDMCPASSKEYRKTPETVLPGKRYVSIKRVE